MKTRTNTYMFDVSMEEGAPVGENAELLEILRIMLRGSGFRVKLQGRGPRKGIRSWRAALPLTESIWASVYVYRDRRKRLPVDDLQSPDRWYTEDALLEQTRQTIDIMSDLIKKR